MTLQLKNIGMIKEATVKIDGLTVIAGENDTGKSTCAKMLYKSIDGFSKESIEKEFHYPILYPEMLLLEESYINLIPNDKEVLNYNPIFIETPLSWLFTDFFRDIALIESQMSIKLDYPKFMKDLNFKLFIKNDANGLDIKDKMIDLMGGEFKKDEMGKYFFLKRGEKIEVANTASGIKYFGLFQILSQNYYLNKNIVLILDEPEVHLHPKWQLEMAKIIVELVRSGVKIVVNSHSPYMIEALERYGEKSDINMDFYLAEDGLIDKVEDDNSKTLAKIFHKLSAPYETFDKMDSEILRGG